MISFKSFALYPVNNECRCCSVLPRCFPQFLVYRLRAGEYVYWKTNSFWQFLQRRHVWKMGRFSSYEIIAERKCLLHRAGLHNLLGSFSKTVIILRLTNNEFGYQIAFLIYSIDRIACCRRTTVGVDASCHLRSWWLNQRSLRPVDVKMGPVSVLSGLVTCKSMHSTCTSADETICPNWHYA